MRTAIAGVSLCSKELHLLSFCDEPLYVFIKSFIDNPTFLYRINRRRRIDTGTDMVNSAFNYQVFAVQSYGVPESIHIIGNYSVGFEIVYIFVFTVGDLIDVSIGTFHMRLLEINGRLFMNLYACLIECFGYFVFVVLFCHTSVDCCYIEPQGVELCLQVVEHSHNVRGLSLREPEREFKVCNIAVDL